MESVTNTQNTEIVPESIEQKVNRLEKNIDTLTLSLNNLAISLNVITTYFDLSCQTCGGFKLDYCAICALRVCSLCIPNVLDHTVCTYCNLSFTQ